MRTATYADHRVADEVALARELACQARGCPLPWTIDTGGSRLCSAHATALPREWPAITERLLWKMADAAQRAGAAPAPTARGPLAAATLRASPEQVAALRATRDEIAGVPTLERLTRRWLELRERERAGERLTRPQADAWRAGLRLGPEADAWAPAWFERAPQSRRND